MSDDLKEYLDRVQKEYSSSEGHKEPSTVEQYVGLYLYKHGMRPGEIVDVLNIMKISEKAGLPGMRWQVPLDHYPEMMLGVLCLLAESMAMEWLEENKPKHIALSMFKMKQEDRKRDSTPEPSTE